MAVAGSATDDVWMVGRGGYCGPGSGRSWIAHWDGSTWSVVHEEDNAFADIAVVAPDDVWAVGEIGILHWDGTEWTSLSSDRATTVWAEHGSNVWVGAYGGSALRWDGASWTRVPTAGGPMHDLHGLAADDIWAVSDAGLVHWNGEGWSVVASEEPPASKVAGVRSNDLWALGKSGTLLHWDGTRWSSSSTTVPGLDGVIAFERQAWAFGGTHAYGADPGNVMILRRAGEVR